MSLLRIFNKYLSGPIILTLLFLVIISCKKEDVPINDDEPLIRKEDTLKTYSPTVKFEVTGRLLEGNRIDCIEPNYIGLELFIKQNFKDENLYFDTSTLQLISQNRLMDAIKFAGARKVLFGTDTPYGGKDNIRKNMKRIEDLNMSGEDKELILGGNMERILKID